MRLVQSETNQPHGSGRLLVPFPGAILDLLGDGMVFRKPFLFRASYRASGGARSEQNRVSARDDIDATGPAVTEPMSASVVIGVVAASVHKQANVEKREQRSTLDGDFHAWSRSDAQCCFQPVGGERRLLEFLLQTAFRTDVAWILRTFGQVMLVAHAAGRTSRGIDAGIDERRTGTARRRARGPCLATRR